MAEIGKAGKRGMVVGWPCRDVAQPSTQTQDGGRYSGCDCPICFGPLLHAPQCSGRALGDAEPGEPFPYDPLPGTHIAVVCKACAMAFYPFKEM